LLIVEDEGPYRFRELFALPTALAISSNLTLAFRHSGTRGFDRVGGSTKVVCGDVRYYRGLAGSIGGVPSGSAQCSCRSHGMATCGTRLRHRDLAACPSPRLRNSLARARV
jgi:hypothetical protein